MDRIFHDTCQGSLSLYIKVDILWWGGVEIGGKTESVKFKKNQDVK